MSTNCAFPPELDDKQLFVYLDGEADRETATHLERCTYCRERAASLDRLQKRLTTRLYRMTCPSPIELGEYHLRTLPAPQMLVVGQHLRECPHCAREVSQLEDFLSDLEPMPRDSVRGKAQFLIARLVGGPAERRQKEESGFAPVVPALRGEAKGPITFEADGIVIVLDLQPADGGKVNILGQVAADDQEQWAGAVVKMLQVDMPELIGYLDDLGAFAFEELRPGSIQLQITSPSGIEVRIPNVKIAV